MLSTRQRARGFLQILITTFQDLERGVLVGDPSTTSLPNSGANLRSYHDEAWENSDNMTERPATPWARTVQR